MCDVYYRYIINKNLHFSSYYQPNQMSRHATIEPFSDEVRALLALNNGNNDNADGEELIDDDDFV